MSEPAAENMICPKCGQFQPRAETCRACGVIVAKLRPGAAPPPAAAPAATPAGHESAGKDPPKLPVMAAIAITSAIAGVAIALAVGFFFMVVPKDMTVAEFVEAKKSAPHFRDFRTEGTIEPYRSVVEVSSGENRLSSIKISANDVTGYLYYDPDEITFALRKGDLVSVRGSFKKIPFLRMRGQPELITVAVATSIEVIRAAAAE